ncbi:ROK family protein [Jatrophihabitans sp.]|uniref:ROK family protein n=1 Tax=Jatrophihabitans sp. TaxID=1932789 RepID=UPI002C0B42A8|nr:ROK family transcriptional regulator [Jatrophihabitans sp.]
MTAPGGPAGQQTVRRHNLGLISTALAAGPSSRAELAQRTGLTKATVSSLVDQLIARRIVVEGEPAATGVGRPARPVQLDPDGPVALGVEINVDYLAACVLDLTGALRCYRHRTVANRSAAPAGILAQVVALAEEVADELGQPLLGGGLALPGVVGADGTVLRAPNLPSLTGTMPGRELAAALGLPELLVDNEANLGALASLRTEPAVGPDFVYVSGEIGVGAGLVVAGELFRGVHGFAGELGHVVVTRDGPACGCGGQGCVEQYAGQEVLLRAAGQPDLERLEAAVAAGDPAALAAVEQAGSALGVGLASLLNVLDLPTVVLGGGYARLFDAITPALAEQLDRRALAPRGAGRLSRSPLGTDAAVRGAAGAVLDRALRDPAGLTGSGASSGSSTPWRTPRTG